MNKLSREALQILEMIKKYGPIRPAEIIQNLGVSAKTVQKHLSKMLEEGVVKKNGTTPNVFYLFNHSGLDISSIPSDGDEWLIENSYIYSSPSGQIIRGMSGFRVWCEKNSFDFEHEKKLYISQIKALAKQRHNGLFSAKKSILSSRKEKYLDDIFFADFYTFGHYGKTKLGQLVYLGKLSQDKKLIKEAAMSVKPLLKQLLEKEGIKMICYIPPTIKRRVQFMDILKKQLDLGLPEIRSAKVPDAKVAQKTLKKLEDRIENARDTIAIFSDQKIVGNVLIIDDATGSGATMNETARKIKGVAGKKKIKVFGFSVVGSYKGFDVISEV